MIRSKFSALIEFQNSDFSTQAKDFLNNNSLLGNQMKIFYSNYESIKIKNDLKLENFNQSDFMLGIPDFYRYVDQKPLLMNPPSSILHVSNIKKEFCNYEIISKVFGFYGTIKGLKFMNTAGQKGMFLLKFGSLEESFNAMANLNSKEFFGKQIVISFTRSKI